MFRGYALTKCDMAFVLGLVEFSKPICPGGASPELLVSHFVMFLPMSRVDDSAPVTSPGTVESIAALAWR